MPDNASQNQNSLIITLKVVGYFACFPIPTTVLALLFPHWALYIVGTGVVLLLGTLGVWVGSGWDSDESTPELRSLSRYVLIIVPLTMAVTDGAVRAYKERSAMPLVIAIAAFAILATLVYVPFLLTRSLARRRSKHQQQP